YSSITGSQSSGGEGDCAVCLTKFEAKDHLRRLPLCCHAFHVECIDPWLKSNHTCPLCRSTINPTEADIMNKTTGNGNNNSLSIEIGTISRRRDSSESESNRTSYSVGSFDYVIDDGYEIPVESTHRREMVPEIGGGGSRNWLRDYVDRLSSRTMSFGGSGSLFTGSSRRSETVDDYEATHGRIGEEISEYFWWLSGV
ncbi:E3 ubiquitin-protein ligase ATL4-like, partial [Bidens hawaiensis]|uniref:E3 ubiquitin-protein ligase ATL4-like n=1 Tax=Bidens hawaiensis TaxID=980011 RepID=UPI00404A0945